MIDKNHLKILEAVLHLHRGKVSGFSLRQNYFFLGEAHVHGLFKRKHRQITLEKSCEVTTELNADVH